jgi:putative phage-type endonuclease
MEVELRRFDTREDWLAARTTTLGASESAAILGLAPEGRESEFSLWTKKTGLVEPEELDSEWLEIGQVLEGPIADLYARRTKSTLWNPPTPFCVAVHPRLPFLTATIDRWIIQAAGHDDRGDLEIKNVGAFNSDWRDGKDIALPLYVQAQVQHQLAVTGFSWAVVAALVGGNSLKTIEVARNPEFITELEAKAVEFWGRVERKEAPAIDGSAASNRAIKALHPDDSGETVELTEDARSLADGLEEAKEEEKTAKAHALEAENKLRAMLGAATFGTLPDGRIVSLKTTERKGYTAVVQPTKFRTLKIVESKGKKA